MRTYFFYQTPRPIFIYLFLSCSCKTSLWTVQIHLSTCLLGIHSNVHCYSQLNFSIILFSFSVFRVTEDNIKPQMHWRDKCKIKHPCALPISTLGSWLPTHTETHVFQMIITEVPQHQHSETPEKDFPLLGFLRT